LLEIVQELLIVLWIKVYLKIDIFRKMSSSCYNFCININSNFPLWCACTAKNVGKKSVLLFADLRKKILILRGGSSFSRKGQIFFSGFFCNVVGSSVLIAYLSYCYFLNIDYCGEFFLKYVRPEKHTDDWWNIFCVKSYKITYS